jgi:type I restriction-modification system DNA methylase subunit
MSTPNTVLEPTQGEGNLVRAINEVYPSSIIYTPQDFFTFDKTVDIVVGNPPFSPMSIGYDILERCFALSGNIIMLMPWLSIINSEKRTRLYREMGLKKIIHLPRKAFKGSRVQTCILVFQSGYSEPIEIMI